MKIAFDEIVAQRSNFTLVDVRSPSEFARGHIPGAHNIPLMSDQLRALVGTIYVQQGKQEAMRVAMEHIGPQLGQLVEQAKQIFAGGTVCVYCARGGMRSASVAQLYAFWGLPVRVLAGGYKAFRNWTIAQLQQPRHVYLLGGKTGSGKTQALAKLAQHGQQTIDLEALADHRGSVFGGNLDAQATQQQFENDLAVAWYNATADKTLWLEDESRKIGSVIIPEPVWTLMQHAPVYYLDVPQEERVQRVLATYGTLDNEFIKKALMTIAQQLGGHIYHQALELLAAADRRAGVELLLAYYDKKYAHGLGKKQNVTAVPSVADLLKLL